MSIYDEAVKKQPLEEQLEGGKLYEALHNQLGTGLDYKDSIIFINSLFFITNSYSSMLFVLTLCNTLLFI